MIVSPSPDAPAATTELARFTAAFERFGRAARRARGRANQAHASALSYAQYLLVEPLLGGEPIAVCALAEAAEVSQPTATRILARLVREGLVRRLPDAGDRRVARIELTADGHAAAADKRAEIMAVRERIFASIPQHQRAQAGELLERLAVAIEEL